MTRYCACGVRLMAANCERGTCERCFAPIARNEETRRSLTAALLLMQREAAQAYRSIEILRGLIDECEES
jgi:hypothetical protein